MRKSKKYIICASLIFLCCMLSAQSYNSDYNNFNNYNAHNPYIANINPEEDINNRIDIFSEIYKTVNAGIVRENIPEPAREYLDLGNTDIENISVSDISETFSFGFIFNIIMRLLGTLVSASVRNFLPTLALVITGAAAGALKNLNGGGGKDNFSDITDFVLVICISGTVFYNIRECFYTAGKFIGDINSYMLTMIPVMASLSAVSGNAAAAAANSAGLYAVLNITGAIGGNIIIPVLQICFALSLARQITASSDTVNLSGVSSYIRSVLNWTFIFIMTVLTAVLMFQNILASSADNMAARTVKFTFSSFVPVVGGMLGDVSRTVIGSIQAVKSITGAFGVLVIIITLLPPLITVILNKFMLSISGALALILGMDKQADFFKEMNSLLDITIAIMVSSALVFIFNITLFIKTAVSF